MRPTKMLYAEGTFTCTVTEMVRLSDVKFAQGCKNEMPLVSRMSVMATALAMVSACVDVPTRPGCTVVEVAFGRLAKAAQVVVTYLHCRISTVTGWARAAAAASRGLVVKVPAVALAKVVPTRKTAPVALCSAT